MLRALRLLALSMVLLAGPALAASRETHSGTVAAIDLGRHVLTLQEMGPWVGPETGTVAQTITLTPDTVQRSSGSTPGGRPGGYVGVTVRVVRRGRQLIAVSIDVVMPSAG